MPIIDSAVNYGKKALQGLRGQPVTAATEAPLPKINPAMAEPVGLKSSLPEPKAGYVRDAAGRITPASAGSSGGITAATPEDIAKKGQGLRAGLGSALGAGVGAYGTVQAAGDINRNGVNADNATNLVGNAALAGGSALSLAGVANPVGVGAGAFLAGKAIGGYGVEKLAENAPRAFDTLANPIDTVKRVFDGGSLLAPERKGIANMDVINQVIAENPNGNAARSMQGLRAQSTNVSLPGPTQSPVQQAPVRQAPAGVSRMSLRGPSPQVDQIGNPIPGTGSMTGPDGRVTTFAPPAQGLRAEQPQVEPLQQALADYQKAAKGGDLDGMISNRMAIRTLQGVRQQDLEQSGRVASNKLATLQMQNGAMEKNSERNIQKLKDISTTPGKDGIAVFDPAKYEQHQRQLSDTFGKFGLDTRHIDPQTMQEYMNAADKKAYVDKYHDTIRSRIQQFIGQEASAGTSNDLANYGLVAQKDGSQNEEGLLRNYERSRAGSVPTSVLNGTDGIVNTGARNLDQEDLSSTQFNRDRLARGLRGN